MKRLLGFLVVEPENLIFKYMPIKKRNKTKEKAYCPYKRKRQLEGGFLTDMISRMLVETLLIRLRKLLRNPRLISLVGETKNTIYTHIKN